MSLNDDPTGISSRRHASFSRQDVGDSGRLGGVSAREPASRAPGGSGTGGGAGGGGGAIGSALGPLGGAYGGSSDAPSSLSSPDAGMTSSSVAGVGASGAGGAGCSGSPPRAGPDRLARSGSRGRSSSGPAPSFPLLLSRLFSSFRASSGGSGAGAGAGTGGVSRDVEGSSWREDPQGKRRASGAWGRGLYALVLGLCIGLLASEHLYVRSKAAKTAAKLGSSARALLDGGGGGKGGAFGLGASASSFWGGSFSSSSSSSSSSPATSSASRGSLLLSHESAASAASPVALTGSPFGPSVGYGSPLPRPVVYVGTPGEVSPPFFGVDAARAVAALVGGRARARADLDAAIGAQGTPAASSSSSSPNATALLRGPLAVALESALRGPLQPAARAADAAGSGAKAGLAGGVSIGTPLGGLSGASLAASLDALARSLAGKPARRTLLSHTQNAGDAAGNAAGNAVELADNAASSASSSSAASGRRLLRGLFSSSSSSFSSSPLTSLSELFPLCTFARAPSPYLLEPDAIPRSDPSSPPASPLDALLREAAPLGEVLVAVSDHRLAETGALGMWLDSVRRADVHNYVIVALTKELLPWCEERGARCHLREARPSAAQAGGGANHATSSVKYGVLLEFVRLGYAPLLSDVDVLTLRDPFAYLHRDADLEAMSDGWDEGSAYGESYGVEDPSMGWSRWAAATKRVSYNSGLFFLRANARTLEFLQAIDDRLARENTWDQTAFNEAASMPSHGDVRAPRIVTRVMDLHVFMNSKVLFKRARHMPSASQPVPAMLHINYHPDKVPRMAAAMRYYWEADERALDPFPGGSEPGS